MLFLITIKLFSSVKLSEPNNKFSIEITVFGVILIIQWPTRIQYPIYSYSWLRALIDAAIVLFMLSLILWYLCYFMLINRVLMHTLCLIDSSLLSTNIQSITVHRKLNRIALLFINVIWQIAQKYFCIC
jgi:hypothetical protein